MTGQHDYFGALPDDERAAIATEVGGVFIGDGVPTSIREGEDVRIVRERDGSWWINVDEFADWLDAKAAEMNVPAWSSVASRLRSSRDNSENKVRALVNKEPM